MTNKIVKEVTLEPFMVPNFVRQEVLPRKRQDGLIEAPIYHLSDLDVETLSELCDDFRRKIFEKAGKGDPK